MPAAALDARRDQGLLHAVGTLALAGNFVGIVIGSGIFSIPRDVAAAVGSWAPLAFVACALVMAAIMLCFAEAAARVPTSGGVYGFAAAAFGPFWGWLTGALNWASNLLAAAAVTAAVADAAGALWPPFAAPGARAALIIGWAVVLIAVNIAGVGFAARFVTVSAGLKLIPLAAFVLIGAGFVVPANLQLPLAAGSADIGRAAILCLFMFTGIEAGLSVSGEVRDPARVIPRAIAVALAVITLVYIAIQTVAQGLLGAALVTAKVPLAAALATVSPGLGTLMVVGALVSMLGYLASDAMSSPRGLFAFARDGLLPAAIGRVHPRTRAPWVAVMLHCALVGALAFSGTFTVLVAASTLVVVCVYTIGCAAALRLRATRVEHAGPVRRLPGLRLAALLAFAAMAWVAAQATALEATGIALLIAAIGIGYLFRRRHPT